MKLLPQLPNKIDIVVAVALYFNSPFIKQVLRNSKHAVIRLKDKACNIYYTITHTRTYRTHNDSFTYSKDNKNTFTNISVMMQKYPIEIFLLTIHEEIMILEYTNFLKL